MAGTWIAVLTVAVFSAQHCYSQEYYGPCSTTNELAPYPGNCNLFLTCTAAGHYIVQRCATKNTVFDVTTKRCDYRIHVPSCRDNVTPSACSPNPCMFGTCNPSNQNSQGYTCTCYAGYTGVTCSQDINECTENPSLCRSGTCKNTPGYFTCDCTNTGNSGLFCEIPLNNTTSCNQYPCGPGRCISNEKGFTCDCTGTNFEGTYCNVPKVSDPCSVSPCSNGGRCNKNGMGGYFCNCTGTGYTGSTCTDNVTPNPCSTKPCLNGDCYPTNFNSQGYGCTCHHGYIGINCSIDVNECTENPSLCRGGTCKNTPGYFECDCTNTNNAGVFCEIPLTNVTSCNYYPCGPGLCIRNANGFTCDCTGTNFEGPYCRTPRTTPDPCYPNPCGPGRCSGTDRDFKCDCRSTGYEGVFCELPIVCSSYNPCLNGGLCLNVSGLPFCECKNTGYTGLTCEIPVTDGNYCFPKACANGQCINKPDSYTCDCSRTVFFGRMCNFTACNSQAYGPCLNGGLCHAQVGADYTCSCPPYLTGKNCAQLVNVEGCPAHQCPNNVPKYNYPNWNDRTCQSYYTCQNGLLQPQTCGSDQKFDVLSMMCKSLLTTQPAVYCDAFRA